MTAFAIIRLAILGGLTLAFTKIGQAATADSAPADSAATIRPPVAWLPLPVEDVEAPERLDQPPADPAIEFSVRAAVRDRRLTLTRVAAERESGRTRIAVSALGSDAEGASAGAAGATIAFHSEPARFDVAIGALAARGAGALLGTEIGLSRRTSRPQSPRTGIPALGAPAGPSGDAVVGLGLRREARSGSALPGFWFLAGRRAVDRTLVAAGGAGASFSRGTVGIAVGTLGGAFAAGPVGAGLDGFTLRRTVASASASASIGPRGAAVAGEWLLTWSGFSALVEAGSGGGPIRVGGRWRYESRSARPAAAELAVETGTRRARARLTMASGSQGSAAGMAGTLPGLVQVECRWTPPGRGPVLLRLGRSGDQRYAVFDAVIARGGGRTLALLATRRARPASTGGERVGSSLGGRLDLASRQAGGLEAIVEAVRADPVAGVPAWSSGLHATGATTLRSLTRSGVALSARGWLRLGRLTLGALVTSVEDAPGRHATAATIWMERRVAGSGR